MKPLSLKPVPCLRREVSKCYRSVRDMLGSNWDFVLDIICHEKIETELVFSLWFSAAAAAKSLQSCPTLCDPIDGSPPGSPVSGILQARTLEWVAISFSSAWKWEVKVKLLSPVRLFATPWTAAYQAPPSMGFPRQEYWSGCHCLLCVMSRFFWSTL